MQHGNTAHGHASRTGVSRTYASWAQMRNRCYNPNVEKYQSYGGRGITVEPEWINSFEAFLRDMGECPSSRHVLDRKDNDGNYTKDNCRWVLWEASAFNKGEYKNNTSGRKGVSKRPYGWVSYGSVRGQKRILYIGPSFELACSARENWEQERRLELGI